MDAHKLATLRAIGFTFPGTCAGCIHFERGLGVWGTCGLHRYEHGKHTEATRHLSVHEAGRCPSFAWDPATVTALSRQGWGEFFIRKEPS